jgi:hypothetical protein
MVPMTDRGHASRRALEPHERTAEVLFGLIMVLTFTGSLSIAEAGREDIRTMLIGALGCNIAWGIIDGILYLMGCLAEKGKGLRMLRAARDARDPGTARRIAAEAFPEPVASVLTSEELLSIADRLRALPEPPARLRLGRGEWRGAIAVFLVVFLSTFPVALPFLLLRDAPRALRLSHGIAVAMLFAAGVTYGRWVGGRPWLTGICMVLLGLLLAGLTKALGG